MSAALARLSPRHTSEGSTPDHGIFLPSTLAQMGERLVVAGGEDYVPDGDVYNRDDPVAWLREPDGPGDGPKARLSSTPLEGSSTWPRRAPTG